MQLGDILESASVPVVGKPIKFHVLRRNPDGTQVQALAEATMLFVDESLRHEADKHAEEYLRASPLYKSTGIVPAEKRREEQYYCFLIRALRDVADKSRPFCPLGDYDNFRRALVAPVVEYLLREYQKYVRDEYPELATESQVTELVEEAVGK